MNAPCTFIFKGINLEILNNQRENFMVGMSVDK